MRISFVLPYVSKHGGVRIVALYASELVRRGHEVRIVSTPRPKTPIRSFLRYLKGNGTIFHTNTQNGSFFDGIDVAHNTLPKFRPVTDSDVPDGDLVVATWWETAEWVSRLSASKGRKFYLVQHDERVFHPTDSRRRERCARTWSLPLKKIVVSRWLANLMATNGETDICLVPNPIDTELFSPASDRHRNKIFRIGFFYSPAHSKGTDIIIAAIFDFLKEEPNVTVVSFGFDPPIRALPLPKQVEYFTSPSQMQIRKIYSSCDAWVFGSRSEGYGLPIIEAMACGTPVIAAPAGAAPDIVPAGGGILLSTPSSREIIEGIRLLMSETQERWKMRSDAALAEARKHSIEVATDTLLSALL